MSRKKGVAPHDRALFLDALAEVRPLQQDRVLLQPPRPGPVPAQTRRDEKQVLRDMVSDAFDPADLETGNELLYWRPGIQHGVVRRLRRGLIPVEAELDLHGMTRMVARETLARCLREWRLNGVRCVRIIHGKGLGSFNREPVLKTRVARWLSQRDDVLAFCQARPVDGGAGAAYVLLKRS